MKAANRGKSAGFGTEQRLNEVRYREVREQVTEEVEDESTDEDGRPASPDGPFSAFLHSSTIAPS